jgi:pyruvate dehydrogenase E2 component (dihydrolipoamide acetyltransferase)
MAESATAYQVVMPKLGLTMTEATLVEWLKQDGEPVEKGEMLFVLESEKSTLEIEAPASGVLHILVRAGETVPVQTPIALLGGSERPPAIVTPSVAAVPRSQPGVAAGQTAPSTGPIPAPTAAVPASPKARALARSHGMSLQGISGTGPRAMIVASDVQEAMEEWSALKVSPVARRLADTAGLDLTGLVGSGPGGRIMRQDVEDALEATSMEEHVIMPESRADAQPLAGLRAVIAGRLSASWRERPHVTLTTEADATNLVNARQQAMVELGDKVSYDALLVALVAYALREHPNVNVRLTGAGIEYLAQINIGVAVDTERGLLVPVVRDAELMGLAQIQRALGELMERVLAGRSLPDDLSGGTFTITNLGMFEVDAFTPIINPPESAILGVGRIISKPVVLDGQIVPREMMALSLSFDHRLIDGAPAARFLQRVKQLVERPFALAFSGQRA